MRKFSLPQPLVGPLVLVRDEDKAQCSAGCLPRLDGASGRPPLMTAAPARFGPASSRCQASSGRRGSSAVSCRYGSSPSAARGLRFPSGPCSSRLRPKGKCHHLAPKHLAVPSRDGVCVPGPGCITTAHASSSRLLTAALLQPRLRWISRPSPSRSAPSRLHGQVRRVEVGWWHGYCKRCGCPGSQANEQRHGHCNPRGTDNVVGAIADTLCVAGLHALFHHETVYAVEAGGLPGGSSIAAIFRTPCG